MLHTVCCAMSKPDSDNIEILVKHPGDKQTAHKTPLLFIHGAYTAAWCWDEHFLDWFATQGYSSYALSLSGHGGSRGRKHLDSFSINDYVDDVAEVVATLPAPPVLIGHSMGGFVVQKYLECDDAPDGLPGAVLMCSVPPQGLMASAFGLMFQKPGLLRDLNALMTGGRVAVETLRDALFAQPVSTQDLLRYLHLAQPESQRAIWDMALLNLPRPSRVRNIPLLVLGAEFDHLTPAPLAKLTADTYGVTAEIFPGMGHGLMLESEWQKVAERIRDWLVELGIQ